MRFILFHLTTFNLSPSMSQPRLLRFSSKANHSSNNSDDDSFEFFPWSDSDSEFQWLPEDRVTLFTTDGLFQIGGKMVPRCVRSSDKQGKSKTAKRFRRYRESNYMDPNQGLCLGALFVIAATNVLGWRLVNVEGEIL
uniref:Uncharacterized protein LOC101499657 n=2 Tax=Cicer arietinum TaxID=3827 RepID=A0A1S2Z2C8_CICAR|nr:uncharacterized protein LOC101499657 [Cicer arietinum]